MRKSARDAFYDFSTRFEGAVPWLYLDVIKLVSIGVGILADPIEHALHLPLVHASDGRPATRMEIEQEWKVIKGLGEVGALKGHLYAHPYTTLRLTSEGLRSTFNDKLNGFLRLTNLRFPGFAEWPADAQMATMSMVWACGPALRFPKLAAALMKQDFRTAAQECHIKTEKDATQPLGNPGVIPRNKANKTLFINAALILEGKLDPDVLVWPLALADRIATPPEMAAVRPDQLEEEPRIVHPLSYPTGYVPKDDEEPPPDDAA